MTEGKGRGPRGGESGSRESGSRESGRGEFGGTAFAPSDRPRRSEASEGEQAGEDYFVLDLHTGKYYSLGEVGGFIWLRLDGGSSLAQIAKEVTAAFEVAERQAEADVIGFVGMLETLGLIEAE